MNVTAQRLLKNEFDKFNKWQVKETSWMYISTQWKSALTVQARKVDDLVTLNFKIGLHDVFRVDEGENMQILLSNNETLTIPCTIGEVAYSKNGQWMAKSTYKLSKEQIDKLTTTPVSAIRMPIGSHEYSDFTIKEKHSRDIMKCLKIL